MKRLSNRTLVSLTLALAGAAAFAAVAEGLPAERLAGGVAYVTGGVTDDQAAAFKQARSGYPLTVELFQRSGGKNEFTADAQVQGEYFRDVGDHLVQVTGELQRQIDDLSTLTSTFFNANATRLNRQATRLTVIATFFLVWTLVTSFFGQNFAWMTDHISSLGAFLLYDGLLLVIPTIVLAIYFWRRREQWW